MKQIFACVGVAALAAMSAVAQNDQELRLDKAKAELQLLLEKSKVMSAAGGVMGRTVKGAPYSGTEISESTQVLADGTRIHNETRTSVYRDGEGRVRRESGDSVNIWDPVANVSYALDTKSMTAHKMPMAPAIFMRQNVGVGTGAGVGGGYSAGYATATTAAAAGPMSYVTVQDGLMVVTRDGKTEKFPVPADGNWTSEDGKIRAIVKQSTDAEGKEHTNFMVNQGQIVVNDGVQVHTMPMPVGGGGGTFTMVTPAMVAGQLSAETKLRTRMTPPNIEQLGEQVVEGVKSRGTRSTSTVQAGEIGNDRPLTTVAERWYSDDLQTEILNKRTDPRTGENIFRVTNINRAEPAAYLFQVPSSYNLIERK